jgi:hypothetical protein
MSKVWHTHRWLLLIIVIAFAVRLYRVDNPIADWHSWRQADTASVSVEYVKHGIDLLRPRYHDLSNIPSNKDNPEGYRMVEFPIINAVVAAIVQMTGADLIVTSRLISISFSIVALSSLFFLVRELSGKRIAYLTALCFALLPYCVYYSRTILPEPIMLGSYCLSFLGFYWWLKRGDYRWAVISWLALVMALLMKPFVAFLVPVYVVIAWQKYGWKIWKRIDLLAFGLSSLVPLYFWRDWIKQFPEGIPASDWLFNSNHIRLRPAWFRWLGWERLTKLMLGYVGIAAFPFNLLRIQSDTWVYAAWWLGIALYLIVIATGNVQHDYYQVMTIPIVCITLARGLSILYDLLRKKAPHLVAVAIPTLLLLATLFLAWQQVKGYFNVNHWEYVRAGQAADRLLPEDAKIIAPAYGDTQFLYQTNRRGWPIGFEIEDKINKGATHYLTTSDDDESRQLETTYTTLEKGQGYLLLDLRHKL